MSLFKKIDQVLASLGNIKAMQRTHVDTFTENKIKNIKGTKTAEGKRGQLFFDFQELAGFEFLNLSLLSNFQILTGKGAQLLFQFNKSPELLVISDTLEIESEFSNVSNRYLTLIEFGVDRKEKKQILSSDLKSITLIFKNRKLSLDISSINLNSKQQQIVFPTIHR